MESKQHPVMLDKLYTFRRTEVADGKMERKGAETALMEISPIILGFKVVLEFLKLRFCTLLLRMSCLRCNVHFEVRSH
ncbi:unnamed protein product [Urochloa humidicola]